MPVDCKKTMHKSYFKPTLTYASETWTMIKKDKSRIQAAEMRFLRSIVQKTRKDRIRNKEMRNRLKIEKLQGVLDGNRIRWFGHVMSLEVATVLDSC